MPKLATPLTEKQNDGLPPRAKQYSLGDGKGLNLLVMPSGKKYWRMGTKHHGNETTLAGGVYPSASLNAARQWRESMQKLFDAGINPNDQKREQRKQLHTVKPKTPKLQFFVNELCCMIIETYSNRLVLSSSQLVALKAFLNAAPDTSRGD